MIEVFNFAQGSPEWHAVRAGIVTASEFSCILAKGEGKTRAAYMRRLAGEIITGQPHESFQSRDMERGKKMEDEARERYAFEFEVEPQLVGFVRNDRKGASPDSLIGKTGGLEIKTKRADILIEVLQKDEVPNEHKAQCQGVLLVTERDWIDFVAYWPKMPMFRKRMYRDEKFIGELSRAIDLFNEELDALVNQIRGYERRAA